MLVLVPVLVDDGAGDSAGADGVGDGARDDIGYGAGAGDGVTSCTVVTDCHSVDVVAHPPSATACAKARFFIMKHTLIWKSIAMLSVLSAYTTAPCGALQDVAVMLVM